MNSDYVGTITPSPMLKIDFTKRKIRTQLVERKHAVLGGNNETFQV